MAGRASFRWGISIDHPWAYAGLPPPKPIFMPHVPSLRLPRGLLETLEHSKTKEAFDEMRSQQGEAEPGTSVRDLCDDLVTRLKEARINLVRSWFPWNYFEEKVGGERRYLLDTFVETLSSAGIEILAVLGNGYTRFLPEGLSLGHLQKYVKDLIPPSSEIVRHYGPKIKMWQIENEPNWWMEHLAVSWRAGLIWLDPKGNEVILKSLYDVVRA